MSEWKETELGRIPRDWDTNILNNVCSKITDGSHFSPKESPDEQFRIATVKDMLENDFDLKNCKTISKNDFDFLVRNGCKAEKGDVLFSKDGSIGNVIYFNKDYELTLLSSIAIFKPNLQYITGNFLSYYLKSNIAQYQIRKNFVSGSALPRVVLKDIKNLKVILPKLPEQKRISKTLSTIDNKIDLLRRQNETLEVIAQTLFKRWFVEFEFPDERGRPYKSSGGKMVSSELGVIPDGWSEKCFYELGAYINGGAFKQEDFSQHNAGLPIIKIVELKYGITNQTKYTEKQVTDKIIINDNDILFSWSGSPETSIDIFVWNLGRGVLNQHTFKVIPNKSIEKSWLYNLLKFYKPLFIRIAKQKQTTGLGHVTVSDLRENKVVFPNNKILTKSNLIADPIFKKYYLNLKEINTVSKLRDILLPKLMSGQIRVK